MPRDARRQTRPCPTVARPATTRTASAAPAAWTPGTETSACGRATTPAAFRATRVPSPPSPWTWTSWPRQTLSASPSVSRRVSKRFVCAMASALACSSAHGFARKHDAHVPSAAHAISVLQRRHSTTGLWHDRQRYVERNTSPRCANSCLPCVMHLPRIRHATRPSHNRTTSTTPCGPPTCAAPLPSP